MHLNNEGEIGSDIKDIGIGPTMYLMFLKSLRNMFLILSLINLPIILIYCSGEGTRSYSGIDKFFGQMTIGNIGENYLAGFRFHVKHKGPLKMQCSSGELERLVSVGFFTTTNPYDTFRAREVIYTRARVTSSGQVLTERGFWNQK
jgi:hypothetical protein